VHSVWPVRKSLSWKGVVKRRLQWWKCDYLSIIKHIMTYCVDWRWRCRRRRRVHTSGLSSKSRVVTVQDIGGTHLCLLSVALTANHVFFVKEVAKTLRGALAAGDAARRPRRPLRHRTVLVDSLTDILKTYTPHHSTSMPDHFIEQAQKSLPVCLLRK